MGPGKISIVSLGDEPCSLAERVCSAVASRYELTCEILPDEPRPDFALNAVRGQYDAMDLLDYLDRKFPGPDRMILALAHVDLFISVFTFVFGQARLAGRSAIVSTFRLREEYYGRQCEDELLFSRVEKSAIHEVGHMMGLTHCADRNCVMHASNTIADTDVKSPMLCANCHAGLR